MDPRKVRGSARPYLSVNHIYSAALFARKSAELEANRDKSDNIYLEYRAYVIGAVMGSVAFMESAINEVFTDAADKVTIHNLPNETATLLAAGWNLETVSQRASILEKYQLALLLANRTLFDKGIQLYQDARLLIGLRNTLVHFSPRTIVTDVFPGEEIPIEELEKKLTGKFPPSPILSKLSVSAGAVIDGREIRGPSRLTGNTFFPEKCLGHGCAKWAVESSLKFTDEFFSRMGLTWHYERFRSSLTTG